MKKNKKIVLAYSTGCAPIYFTKDVFLTPYYLAKVTGKPLEFYYGMRLSNDLLPYEYRAAHIEGNSNRKNVTRIQEFYDLFNYVIGNYKRIDTLFIIGFNFYHLLIVYFLKKLNRSAKVVVLGDMEPKQALEIYDSNFFQKKSIFGYLKSKLADFCFNNSILLVANTVAYEIMKKQFSRRGWKGLLNFYPCLDDEKFNEYGIVRKSWEQKENILICVGRIGCYQKNTEMLLEALKKVDLKDWKIYMIGPITNSFFMRKEYGSFQDTIKRFYDDYPQYSEKLIFTGMIHNQKEMMELYNRAKILLSTSRYEGFANTYSQAAAFGCYIVSTDVGGADIASNKWKFGTKLEQENPSMLATALSDIIEGRIVPDTSKAVSLREMSYSFRIKDYLLPKLLFE